MIALEFQAGRLAGGRRVGEEGKNFPLDFRISRMSVTGLREISLMLNFVKI